MASSSPDAETHIEKCGSGINVANFVSSRLRRDGKQNNYKSWKEQMLCLVESQGLLEFIDGEAPPPPPKDGVGYVAWRRTDRLVKGWILGALSDETLEDFVSHMDSAKDVWLDLEKAFCSPLPRRPPPSYPDAPQPAAEIQLAQGGSETINMENFVSSKLTGDRNRNNYVTWKEQMLSLLESQGLVRFIDGKALLPPPHDTEWRRIDWLVKGWILGALNDEALGHVVNLNSARDVWLELENMFSADLDHHGNVHYYPPLLTQQPAAPPQHRSEINVADFVPVKLSRLSNWNSYKLWKQQILFLVQSQNLAGFLDTRSHPPAKDNVNYGAWRQSDGMVKGWILEALSGGLAKEVVHLDSAKDVWLVLEYDFLATSKLTWDEENDWRQRLELYKAAMGDDLAKAEMILKKNPDAIRTIMDMTSETPLHIAVASGKSTVLVEKLVELSDDHTLSKRDNVGYNALHIAARMGNHRAAQILIERLPDLLYAPSDELALPINCAAEYGHRETVELLMRYSRDDYPINPFAGQTGFNLLRSLICADFLDMALDLVNRYPNLARMRPVIVDDTALSILASRDTVFSGRARLNFWESLMYSCIQLEMECSPPLPFFDDTETQNEDELPRWRKHIRKLHSTLWKFISELVPCVKRIRKRKWMHGQGLRLAKSICSHMVSLGPDRARICKSALRNAATVGNHEIIEVIVGTFPQMIYEIDLSIQQNFLHLAVRNRSERVFNLLYQTTNHRYQYSNTIDSSGNSILHMAAFLAPPHKLNLVSGAALQMQRELQWFKEVAKFVSPFIKDRNNRAGKTPAMIFTEEHRNLKVEGEKWMKDTANSCTIAAALIVTVVFAAAITVPGGNQSETGYPMLWEASAFTIFAVSDAISLFTSTTSLLMFLSILTSRYAEQDFLYALPRRLGIGLVTLFLSILFMMAAFCSTVFLVFGRKSSWVLIPAAALTCLPISSFVLLQFPLLIAVVSSTYGKGIFGKQSNRPFP